VIELSNNEATSLVKLAARGVGYPWGLAEEAAHVSRWLLERQLPALETFCTLFARVDEREFSNFALPDNFSLQGKNKRGYCSRDELCPLVCGSAILDAASVLLGSDEVELKIVLCPMLLMPFVYEASFVLEKPVSIKWKEAEFIFNGSHIIPAIANREFSNRIRWMDSSSSLSIRVVSHSPNVQSPATDADVIQDDAHANELWPVVCNSRVTIEQTCLESLKQFAHRTYAPASEQSRLSGAGAGTSDND